MLMIHFHSASDAGLGGYQLTKVGVIVTLVCGNP